MCSTPKGSGSPRRITPLQEPDSDPASWLRTLRRASERMDKRERAPVAGKPRRKA